MIILDRKVSYELLYLRALSKRMTLDAKSQRKLTVLEKGYAGEKLYDRIFDEVGHSNVYVLRDVYLKIEGSVTQYDSIIISDNEVVVNEIKNFTGNYSFSNNKWYLKNSELAEDPIAQLKRAMGKLVKLKYSHSLNFEVEGKVVFPNIEFLFHSPNDATWDMMVLRSSLRNYLNSFHNLKSGRRAEEIARAIASHSVENPYFNETADFSALKKGFYCRGCDSFNTNKTKFHIECLDCGQRDTIQTMVLQAINDYRALFRSVPLTAIGLYNFLDRKVSLHTLYRILNTYCSKHGSRYKSWFEFNYYDFDDAYSNAKRLWRYKDHVI